MSACLLILIGLPGSGKTTLARRLCSALSGSYRMIHVEYDAAVDLSEQARFQAAAAAGDGNDGWRTARRELEDAVEAVVTGGEIPESWRNAVRRLDNDTETPMSITHDADCDAGNGDTQRPTVFIIDDNMYLRSMRYRYFQLARRHQLGFAAVLLDVPVAECLLRNSSRAWPVPEAAIEAMAARLERPELSRLWEARSVTLAGASSQLRASVESEGDRESLDRETASGENERREDGSQPSEGTLLIVSDLVAAALSSPVAPITDNSLETEASRLVCSTSQLHQLDQQLRRLVGQHAAGCAERARAANLARQRLMRRVRAGEIGLGVEPSEEDRFVEASRRLFEAELAAAGTG